MRTELLDLSKVDGCACGGRCVGCNDAATAVGTRVYARVPDRGLPRSERRAVAADSPLDNPHEPIDPTDEPTPYWPKHFPPLDLPGPKTGGGFPTPWGPEIPPGVVGARVLPSLDWLGCGVFSSSRFRITGDSTGELASLDEMFRQHMTTWEIPNGALAVVEPTGRLVLARGYTNLDAFTNGEPTFCARPDSVFRLGSISKSFTAAAVMQLVERGRITLRDRVADLIDFTPLRIRSFDESLLTVRVLHLLTHTGGWDSATGVWTGFEPTRYDRQIAAKFSVGLPIGIDQIIEFMSTYTLDFTAGTARQYSNYGYVLAARVVETVSGMSLSDYLARNIWDPLGLRAMGASTSSIADRADGEVKYFSNDSFGQPAEIRTLTTECGEYPYVCSTLRGEWTPEGTLAQWSCLRPYGYRNIANGTGAGTLRGSVVDLARWLWQFSDGGRVASPILQEANLLKMITDPSPQVSNIDGTGQRYGLGWGLPRLSGRSGSARDVAHSGDMDGTSAYAFVNRTTVPGLCWCYVFNRNIGIDFPPEGAGWGFEDGVLSRLTDSARSLRVAWARMSTHDSPASRTGGRPICSRATFCEVTMALFLFACTQPKEPADTAPTPLDTVTDTDDTDDTAEPVDTASALQPPGTFLGDVGFVFTDMAIVGPYACAVTSIGRVFCWTEGGRVCSQPPVDLQAREVTVTGDASYSACALETGSGDAVCWTRDGTLSRTEGPFLTLSGSCGIRGGGEIECWEDFGVCPAREPEGTFIALDARQYGTAVRSDGAVVTWSGPCLEWGGSYDYPTCLDCPDLVEVAGPFVAASNARRGGVCAAYAAGGIYCDTLDGELEAGAPATGQFVDLDSASWWGAAGACALDTNGVTTCWGDDVASSTPFVDIESGRLDAVYGLTPEGTIEEFDAAYPDEWIPCDPALE